MQCIYLHLFRLSCVSKQNVHAFRYLLAKLLVCQAEKRLYVCEYHRTIALLLCGESHRLVNFSIKLALHANPLMFSRMKCRICTV